MVLSCVMITHYKCIVPSPSNVVACNLLYIKKKEKEEELVLK